MEYLMDWIEGQLDDESIFPQKLGMLLFCGFMELSRFLENTWYLMQSSMLSDSDFVSPLSRHTIPTKLQGSSEDDIQALVSCLCPHIPLAFPEDC
jgi:hypothetical protein